MQTTSRIDSAYGALSVLESRQDGPPVLLIHGNSSCKEAFLHQIESPLLSSYRLIALDLPGHGASDNAPDPSAAYALDGYAAACSSVLSALGIDRAVLFGWSLGGHIALELAGREANRVSAAMITGTPPIPLDLSVMVQAFLPSPVMALTGKEEFSSAEAELYAAHTSAVAGQVDPHFLAMCQRTDGRARRMLMESLAMGRAMDEVEIVKGPLPLAVVNGESDVFVNQGYIASLPYGALWEGKCHVLAGLGHAPFLEAPDLFNPIFARFLARVTPV